MKFLNQLYQNNISTGKLRLSCGLLFFVVYMSGCKKLVEVPGPATSVNSANVYGNDATAAAVLTGIYINLSQGGGINAGLSSVTCYAGLSADELALYGVSSNSYSQFYQNALSISTSGGTFWSDVYPVIFVANSAIEGLTNNNSLTAAVDHQLLGEAKFIRAFCYFYLVNLYGNLPLVTSTDYKVTGMLPRISKAQIYQQIIADLKEAQALMNDHYVDATLLNSTTERVRPTKWAATALLARAYLYTGAWADAETQASLVIGNTGLYNLSALNNAFLKNSTEAIWQLQPVIPGQNTPDALLFILPASGPNSSNIVYMNGRLVSSFETGDQRLASWVGRVTTTLGGITTTYYYPYKYKVNAAASVTEYEMVMRLGEQYLIRAEARAQLNHLDGARADLNAIRARAGLTNTTAVIQADVLTAIYHERQVELFTEWGHRWLDLKRTGQVDAVMTIATPLKGGTWDTRQQLYPVPQTEIQFDPNLVQNPGY